MAGVVLNSGTHAQRIGDRLAVAPVDTLWRWLSARGGVAEWVVTARKGGEKP